MSDLFPLIGTRPGSSWINWSCCTIKPSIQSNAHLAYEESNLFQKGQKVVLNNKYGKRYGIHQGTVAACRFWEELIRDDQQWFQMAGGHSRWQSETWFYCIEGSDWWWPESCLVDQQNIVVNPADYFHLTANGQRQDDEFDFTGQTIEEIVAFCQDKLVQARVRHVDFTQVFEGVARGIVESFITVRAFNDGMGFELEHARMLPKAHQIVTPDYWGITFKIDRGEHKTKFTVECENGQPSINTYGDMVGFLNIPTSGSKIERFYFGKLLPTRDLCQNYKYIFNVSVMKDHIPLEKMKHEYSKTVEFRPVRRSRKRHKLYRDHSRAVRKFRKNVTGIEYCLEHLHEFESLQECIDSVPFIQPWWKDRLTTIVMKRTCFYEALRAYQTLEKTHVLDHVSLVGYVNGIIRPEFRCQALNNEFEKHPNILAR